MSKTCPNVKLGFSSDLNNRFHLTWSQFHMPPSRKRRLQHGRVLLLRLLSHPSVGGGGAAAANALNILITVAGQSVETNSRRTYPRFRLKKGRDLHALLPFHYHLIPCSVYITSLLLLSWEISVIPRPIIGGAVPYWDTC